MRVSRRFNYATDAIPVKVVQRCTAEAFRDLSAPEPQEPRTAFVGNALDLSREEVAIGMRAWEPEGK
jgi:hypothetical protein